MVHSCAMGKGRSLVSSTKYTLDRIEDGYAIFLKYPEEEQQIIISLSTIDKPVKAGDRVLIEEVENTFYIEILTEETEKKRADMQSLMDKLRKKNQ